MKKIRLISWILTIVTLLSAFAACGEDSQGGEPTVETQPMTNPVTTEKVTDAITEEIPTVKTYTTFESELGTLIAPVIDIQTALNSHSYDYNRIRTEMKTLAELGFTRVYFVAATNGFGMSCWPKWSDSANRYISGYTFVQQNAKALRMDANRLYITACKNEGMEAYVVYKPYEGGGTQSVPEGVEKLSETVSNAWISTLGGTIYHTDPFIAEHPEYRIQRKQDTELHEELPVTSIEIDFLLSSYSAGSSLSSSGVTQSVVEAAAGNYTLWVSDTNGAYKPYEGSTSCRFEAVTRETFDMSGVSLGSKKYVTMKITGLSVPYTEAKYFAVTFEDSQKLHTIPYGSFTLYSGTTVLSSTVTSFCRYPANKSDTPANYDWGNEASKPLSGSLIGGIKVASDGSVTGVKKGTAQLNGAQDFHRWGFSFGWVYDGEFAFYANSAVYGIARGTIEYVPGGLCEAYQEVRDYWLSQVKQYLDYGADGIDIRPQSHSTMAIDYTNYGYNQPIADRYKELYGVDIQTSEADFLKIALIRGEFFTEFLKAASELTHSYDAIFSTHLVASYETPMLSTKVFYVGHFTDPKLIPDWKTVVDLCDEITIKDNTYGTYNANLAKQIRKYAKEQKKTVWVHAYIQQNKTDLKEYVKAADRDGLSTGVLLYELTFDSSYSPSLVSQVRSVLDALFCKKVTCEVNEP